MLRWVQVHQTKIFVLVKREYFKIFNHHNWELSILLTLCLSSVNIMLCVIQDMNTEKNITNKHKLGSIKCWGEKQFNSIEK